jgi:hypothetical protein
VINTAQKIDFTLGKPVVPVRVLGLSVPQAVTDIVDLLVEQAEEVLVRDF